MVEGHAGHEKESTPISTLVADVFDRRVENYRNGRNLIVETYADKFDKLLQTLPEDRRDTTAIKIQKVLVKFGGYVSEYGSRFTDFVRNIVVWPMVRATKDFPKDKYYQIELARAKAWGEFARDTTKTATNERMAYRDHFLPSAVIGGEYGLAAGAALSVPVAVGIGAAEGAKAGLIAGAYGVAIGAGVGAAIGGGVALGLRLKDRIMGPPVVYYDLNFGGGTSINLKAASDSSRLPLNALRAA